MGRRWYLVGYDRNRQDWRSFRVDRATDVALIGARFRQRELPAEDALAFVRSGFRQIPRRPAVRVRSACDAAPVDDVVGRWGDLVAPAGSTVLTQHDHDVFWALAVLAPVAARFTL